MQKNPEPCRTPIMTPTELRHSRTIGFNSLEQRESERMPCSLHDNISPPQHNILETYAHSTACLLLSAISNSNSSQRIPSRNNPSCSRNHSCPCKHIRGAMRQRKGMRGKQMGQGDAGGRGRKVSNEYRVAQPQQNSLG